MAKDPTKRYATAKELVAALREAAAGKRLAATRRLWLPAIAGATVLGTAIVAIITLRDTRTAREAAATAPAAAEERGTGGDAGSAAPTSQVTFEVIATPPGTVVRDGVALGPTPFKLPVTPGEPLALSVRRAGYAPATIAMAAPATAKTHVVALVPIVGFGGVWRLEQSGGLRRFERVDDHVDAYKLHSESDPGQLYKRFELIDPASRKLDGDVAWVTTETTNRGPHPSCQVAFEVMFVYRQHPETLIAHVGNVKLRKQHDGTCVPRQRWSDVERLARVGDGGDEVVIRAPVGTPVTAKPPIKVAPKNEDFAAPIKGKRNASPKSFVGDAPQEQNAAPRPLTKAPASKVPPAKVPPSKVPPSKVPPSKEAKVPPSNEPEPQVQAQPPPQQQAEPQVPQKK